MYKNMILVTHGDVSEHNLQNIVRCALDIGVTSKGVDFDGQRYYWMNHEVIDHYFSYKKQSSLGEADRSCQFYICYGYHVGLHQEPVNALAYIASHPHLIQELGEDESRGQEHFYVHGGKITFDPYVYVASNIHHHAIKEFIDCTGSIDPARVCKHYIRHGFAENLCTCSFNHWDYLANNYKKIVKLLADYKTKHDYDVFKVTSARAAQLFVSKKGKTKQGVFNPVAFVKAYVDDLDCVNKSKKLTLDTAAEHFVKYYVLSPRIRYECSIWHKLAMFLQMRAKDGFRQIPYNATLYLIENRCF